MASIEILCIGKLKNNPLEQVWDEYVRRLQWPVSLTEMEGKNQKEELEKLSAKIDPHAALIVLDETGKTLSSRDFAQKLEQFQTAGQSKFQFVIGGADGLNDDIRARAGLVLSFGKQTWPHLLARVMLIEQIYRSQQILAGHPYHRD
ncbi:MAG: 23S rRNA (pseudouridine(1915)-N(3))-methyltransferase RlmH [Rhodospirillales bacterium]|nr:23S rRNA (pseudouridine(1915)-N(3))-methyltransferase RlmH [Alphaproteobacteria bacterium]USO03227.1 MAG: 23S rRNA (pseudouridine(1915)-N(3))-methyltransferase RlmH [Rhodospirillales bacterium]